MTTYFCMRHGLTQWNHDKRIQGQSDIDLCKEGRDMARAWAESLAANEFDCILTSGYKRAVQTAEIINEGRNLPMHEDPRLAEQDWGEWSGLTTAELHDKFPGKLDAEVAKGWGFTPNAGENRLDCAERSIAALEQGIDEIIRTVDKDELKILAVTHEGTMKTVIYKLMNHDFMPGNEKLMKKRRLHWLNWNGELSIESLNEKL